MTGNKHFLKYAVNAAFSVALSQLEKILPRLPRKENRGKYSGNIKVIWLFKSKQEKKYERVYKTRHQLNQNLKRAETKY